MRPLVAPLPDLADQAAFAVTQGVAEHGVPLVPHDEQQGVGVKMGIAFAPIYGPVQAVSGLGLPLLAVFSLQLALHVGF